MNKYSFYSLALDALGSRINVSRYMALPCNAMLKALPS